MNKKGFTLIELLAVILILGIIALIAIPTVNTIISDSKIGAWKSTANNIVTSYEQYYQLCQMKNETGVTCYKDFATTATPSGPGLTEAKVKETIDMKGDLPDTFDTLMLNSNGDALVAFTTEDNITCTNIDKTDATKATDMTCTG